MPNSQTLARFADRTAVVTGAGSGIGQATAVRLAAEGARVAVVDIDDTSAERTVAIIQEAGGLALAQHLDIADRDGWEQLAKTIADELGPIDVLVNNAGLGARMTTQEWDEPSLDKVLDTNLKGLLHSYGTIGRDMLAGSGGSIVNTTSLAGIVGIPGLVPYTATKGAIVALTRSAAIEMAPHVRVNAVAPGKILTAFRSRLGVPDLTESELSELGAWYPLQRVGMPEDVAGVIAFLASDDAAFVTGMILPVDGGRTAGYHDITT